MSRLLLEQDPCLPSSDVVDLGENPGSNGNAYCARAGPTRGRIIKNEELERTLTG